MKLWNVFYLLMGVDYLTTSISGPQWIYKIRWYYYDYCTYFLWPVFIFSTCCCLGIAEGEEVWDREVWEIDRQGEVQTCFFSGKKELYSLVSKMQYFTLHQIHNIIYFPCVLLEILTSNLQGVLSSVLTWLHCVFNRTSHSYNNLYPVKYRSSQIVTSV